MKKNKDDLPKLGLPQQEDFEILESEPTEILRDLADPQNSPEMAARLHNLAQTCLMTGKMNEAKEYFQKAVEIYEKISDEHNLVFCLSQYAVVLRHHSQQEKAENALMEVVRISKKLMFKRSDVKRFFIKVYFLNLLELYHAESEAITLRNKLEKIWRSYHPAVTSPADR